MRILLIRPPLRERYQGYLPLGLACIAGCLLRAGHQVSVWDLDAEGWSKTQVLQRLADAGPSYPLMGISTLPGDYPYLKWFSRSIKNLVPEAKLVLGGHFASALPRFLMEDLPVDFVAVGEGEETMVELASVIALGTDPGHVRGIYFRDVSGEIRATPPRGRLETLDSLPFPPWDLFPMEVYLRGRRLAEGEGDGGPGVVSVMAGRGCPFPCNYCDHGIKGYRSRYRSVGSVVDEIRMLQERYGDKIGRIYFWDDILISDRQWIWEFCDTLIRENLRINWTCNCHVNRVEPRLMFRMKQAGCVNVRFGIESGSQKILDALNKGVKVEDALEALRVCLEAGLELTLYIMVGMTGECRETIDETVEFFRRLIQPSYAHQICSISFFMLTPFPGTRLFEAAQEAGKIPNFVEFLERDCDAYDDIPLNLSGQTDEALVELKRDLESRVLHILWDARNQMAGLLHGMVEELRK